MDVVKEGQCVALTNKGKGPRCQYHGKHTHPVTGLRYCGHHYKPPPKKATEPAPPSPAVEIVIPYQLRRKVAARLRRRLEAGPKSNDEPGYLYAYYLQHEDGRNYWKVGRTSRDPEKRHKEWQAAHHTDHVVVTKKVWRIDRKAVKFLESVVHMWFDYCRMYRYPLEKSARILSVWASTGSLIRDADHVAQEALNEEERPVARRKMVEWFWVGWPELDALVTRMVALYCPPSRL